MRPAMGKGPDFEYEGRSRYCYCGMKAHGWVLWTDDIPGRQFYYCIN